MPLITPIYAGLLALLYLGLSFYVVGQRARGKIFMGDGDDAEMFKRMRVHANFNEYVPLALVLLLLAELQGAPGWVVHLMGAMLLVGRALHAWGMGRAQQSSFGRGGGTLLTWAMLLITALAAIGHALW